MGPQPDGWRQRIALLEDENAALRDRGRQLEREQRQLHERIDHLEAERDRLQAEGERLERVNARLREQVEALRRAAKRQAAPFSKGDLRPNPRRAGRKAGAAHGRHGHRPPPEQVDQIIEGVRDVVHGSRWSHFEDRLLSAGYAWADAPRFEVVGAICIRCREQDLAG